MSTFASSFIPLPFTLTGRQQQKNKSNQRTTNEPPKLRMELEALLKFQNTKKEKNPFRTFFDLPEWNDYIQQYTNISCSVVFLPLNQNVNKFYTRTVAHWMINALVAFIRWTQIQNRFAATALGHTTQFRFTIKYLFVPFFHHVHVWRGIFFLFPFFFSVKSKSKFRPHRLRRKVEFAHFYSTFSFNFQLW